MSATYMLCDDLGNPTGLKAEFAKGEPLAYAPRGFIWSCSIGGADEKAETKETKMTRTFFFSYFSLFSEFL